MLQLKKAERQKVKLKIGLSGASGFGKTYSALLLAYGMVNDWSKIAVIDTENKSASLYSHLGDYNVIELQSPFTPERYTEAIKVCENAGIELIIIDSISHEWEGKGGCLEIHAELGGQFNHWAKVTPRHSAFIQSILQSTCHIITTVRRKQDYDMVKNDKGKTEPVKVGLKEVTREGFEYELTVNLELMNENHLVKCSKDRTSLFDKRPEFIITSEIGKELINWANSGKDIVKELELKINECKTYEELTQLWAENTQLQTNKQIIALFQTVSKKLKVPETKNQKEVTNE